MSLWTFKGLTYIFSNNVKINYKILANHYWTDVQMLSFKFNVTLSLLTDRLLYEHEKYSKLKTKTLH